MLNDVRYLLWNRVRGQDRVIRLLREAKAERRRPDLAPGSPLQKSWRCFELDTDGKASVGLLQFLLFYSRVVPDWREAGELLEKGDADGSGRIGYDEFVRVVEDLIQEQP